MDNVHRKTSIHHWLIPSIWSLIVVLIVWRDWPAPMNRFWKMHLYWLFFLSQSGEWVSGYSRYLLLQRSGRAGKCCRFDHCLKRVGQHYQARNARCRFVPFGNRLGWSRHSQQRYVVLPGFVWILFLVRQYLRSLLRSLRQSVSLRRILAGRAGFSGRLWRILAGER